MLIWIAILVVAVNVAFVAGCWWASPDGRRADVEPTEDEPIYEVCEYCGDEYDVDLAGFQWACEACEMGARWVDVQLDQAMEARGFEA